MTRCRHNPPCQRREYWGRGGAGVLFTCSEDGTVLLLLRAAWVEQGGTWGIPGGGIGEGFYRTPMQPLTDMRVFRKKAEEEVEEECGAFPPYMTHLPEGLPFTEYEDCGFRYVTFVLDITKKQKAAWAPFSADGENDAFVWFPLDAVKKGRPLPDESGDLHDIHFGVTFTMGKLPTANPRRRNPEPTVEVYRDRRGEVSGVKVRLAGGEVSAVRPDPAEREMYVGWSGLPESERGKGQGIRMYAALMDWALENDFILTSDETVSREAGRVWEALAKRGYPIRKHFEARTISEGNIGAWYAHGRKPPFLLHRRNPSSSLPRLLRLVPEEEVVATWASLYAEGKHKGHDAPDLERHLGKAPVWAEVAIPHNLYNADWNTEAAPPEELLSEDQLARARRYAARATKLPPGMAAFTGRAKTLRAYVSDGNHRAFAAYLRGEPTARFFMPLPDYERFVERLGQSPARANPRPTTAERTDPALWEAVKREVTAGSKGGVPGEWSARKAQLAVALYKKRGGDYIGPKSPQNSLAKWTREDWRTRSGKPSLVTGERYLPARAIEALSPQEYAATSRAKRAGLLRDEQFTPQPERIREKTARYRKNPTRKKAGDKVPARLLMPTEEEQRAFEEKVREALLLGGVARPRVVSSVALVNTRPPRYLPSVVVHLRDDEEYERARSAALSRRFASVSREYGEGAALRLTQLGKEVSPLRGNPTDLAPCMVTPAPLWLADATFIARLRTPSGRIVDVLSDTKHGGMNTWLTAEGDRSCVLGKARHSDECAPRADVPGDGAYRRIHTAKGVGQTGAGLGFALYLGSALAAEYMGDRGVFSIPLTVPRRETRSGSADVLWKKLLGGTRPLARSEQGWVYCCSDADFTAAERRTKVYKDWLKSESEEGAWMRRDIDVLAGEDVRRSGFVVALGKAAVAPTRAALEKDYNAALTSLQSVFASLSEAEQARIVDADNEFHAGKPDAFVRWARTLDPTLFPSFGTAEVERPWADFAGALASNPARRAREAQPERIREKTARYRRNPSRRDVEAEAIRAIRANLTPDLLAGEYRTCATSGPMASSPVAGHCAVATEALYFMLGGKGSGYTPMNVTHPVKGNARGVSHWYLRTPDGRYLDPTADQFNTPVDYAKGRGRGFPTPKQGRAEPPPSKRAAVLLSRIR